MYMYVFKLDLHQIKNYCAVNKWQSLFDSKQHYSLTS